MLACKMVVNDPVINRQELAVVALPAPDSGLIAEGAVPLVPTGWRVTGLSILRFPSNRVDILSTPEKAAE